MESQTSQSTLEQEVLSKAQIIAAATNDPSLSKDEFILGDRKFKVLDLEYDQYLEFTSYLEPMLKGVAGMLAKRNGISIPGIEIDASQITPGFLMQVCKDSLPQMATIVCNMQAVVENKPNDFVTVEWVKKHGRNPLRLSGIVLRQIARNNIITDFLDFFVQVLPTILRLQKTFNPQTPTTGATPSSS